MDANYLIVGFILGFLASIPPCVAIALRAMRQTEAPRTPIVFIVERKPEEEPKVDYGSTTYRLN